MNYPCVFCGKLNEFLMYQDGCCMECGDKLQDMDKSALISRLVQCGLRVKELQMGKELQG